MSDDTSIFGMRPENLDRLIHYSVASDSAEKDAMPPLAARMVSDADISWVDKYKLVRTLGEGGMGIVYLADQIEPIQRQVALKVIKTGMDTKQVIARFEAERQALAMMDHPNIAKVLDAGATVAGRPYFVMELVDGSPITRYCDTNRLSIKERLGLFIAVCGAIQHAHQKGIIHRDVKPSNVLVAEPDGLPVPKVIDFGIAKATQFELTELTMHTQQGQLTGTPVYMSPEQAQASELDVDTRSDIYSMGVLLYELLTGSTPLQARDLRGTEYDDIRRRICEEEPARPSKRMSSLSGERLADVGRKLKSDPPKLAALLKRDLDWIVMKCLEKDRSRRYETAHGIALDLQRYLRGEPVTAVAPSLRYTLGKYVKRNRLVVSASVAVLMALVLGLGMALIALGRERIARTEANKLQYASDMKLAIAAVRGEAVENAFRLLDRHVSAENQPDMRGWEWYYLDQFRRQETVTLVTGGSISEVDVSPDGNNIVVGQQDKDGKQVIKFIDTKSLRDVSTVSLPEPFWVGEFTFLPDGQQLIANDYRIDGPNHERFLSPELLVNCWPSKVSRDGKWLVGYYKAVQDHGSGPGGRGQPQQLLLRCFETASERQKAETTFTSPDDRMLDHELRISPNSQVVAVACFNEEVKLFSLPDLTLLQTLSVAGAPTCLRWSSDSQYIAVGYEWPPVVQVWDVSKRIWRHHLKGKQISPSFDICFSHDSSLLATSTLDSLVFLWDLQQKPPAERAVLRGHRSIPTSLSFSLDGQKLYSTDGEGMLKVWDTSASHASPRKRLTNKIIGDLAFSPDGKLLAIASRDGKTHLFDTEHLGKVATMGPGPDSKESGVGFDPESYPTLCFSQDGRSLLSSNGDNTATLYDVHSRTPVLNLLGHAGFIHDASFSPDANTIFTVSDDGTLKSWNRLDGSVRESTADGWMGEAMYAIDCSADGKLLAVGGKHMRLTLRDAVTLEVKSDLVRDDIPWYGLSISSLRFSPDGSLLACGLRNEMMLFEVSSWQKIATFTGLSGQVVSVDFTPDGQTLIGVSERGLSQMVNLKLMHAVGDFLGPESRFVSAMFSPDGQTLAVSGLDTGIQLLQMQYP
jgi:eukaryotic-like serine/threonine-protein kinase